VARFRPDRAVFTTCAKATPPVKPVLPGLPEIHALIRASARKYQVPVAFVKSIVAVESNFNSTVVSRKGAVGLMQLMPATAREYGADPTVPEQNIDAGTHYLRFLMERYRRSRNPMRTAIAAYNAGPRTVDRYGGVPPFRETRGYVVRVFALLRQFQSSQ
jgi:soluble lytic murein transglycosylase-like protein